MPFDTALTTGDGVQNLRHSVTDVILYHITDEQTRQEDADHRIDQVQQVTARDIEVPCQELFYPLDQHFQEAGCQRGENPD